MTSPHCPICLHDWPTVRQACPCLDEAVPPANDPQACDGTGVPPLPMLVVGLLGGLGLGSLTGQALWQGMRGLLRLSGVWP